MAQVYIIKHITSTIFDTEIHPPAHNSNVEQVDSVPTCLIFAVPTCPIDTNDHKQMVLVYFKKCNMKYHLGKQTQITK